MNSRDPGSWLLVLVILALFWGAWAGWRTQKEEVTIPLSQVQIIVHGMAPTDKLMEAAGLTGGDSAFSPDDIVLRLEALPVVSGVTVEQAEEGKMTIFIHERVPVARLVCPSLGVGLLPEEDSVLVDAQGVVVREESYFQKIPYLLPPVHGLKPKYLEPGKEAPSHGIRCAAAVIARWDESEPLGSMVEARQLNP
ncbi:MAG: hypothetical protein AAGJ31_15835, partial [Verrucomicrobiota bacterium]